jgi:hypothetical protein
MAAGNGMRDYIDNLVGRRGDQSALTVTRFIEDRTSQKSQPQKIDEVQNADDSEPVIQGVLTDQDRQKVEAVDGAKKVTPSLFLELDSFDGADGKYRGDVSIQIDKRIVEYLGQTDGTYQLGKSEAAVGQSYLTALGFDSFESAIGQQITLNFVSADNIDSYRRPTETFPYTFIIPLLSARQTRPMATATGF